MLKIPIKYIAQSKWFDIFKSPSFLLEYSVLVNITAKEFQAKCYTLIPCFRNDADKPGNNRRVEKVLHMSFGVIISFENLKMKYKKIFDDGIVGINIHRFFSILSVQAEGIEEHIQHYRVIPSES